MLQSECPDKATLPVENFAISETNYREITASADGAYQRRGSGRCHNSLSGVASLIGKQTGKVIAFTARYKRCRICNLSKKQHKKPRQHTCRRNWGGSAKAMEPDMVVEMLKSTKEKKAVVKTLIGDDDTTAFNRARHEVCPTMEKSKQ
uniref:Uncharacterized protein LOC111117163 n=1 Tax=Crassostrea virginica TaxID=6565 RepID=A0A8B8C884_CRAVI|nr:uncharacterized protein LOC111117163 [Crassostrea virginica]